MEELTDDLIRRPQWTDGVVGDAGISVVDTPVVSVGGGFGSFCVVDLLRVAGVSTDAITVLSPNRTPHETYSFLARNSQIRDGDRLRSDSSAMPDNVWGFPSYALAEARRGAVSQAARVVAEPVLAEFFTPISGDVYRRTEAEAARIGWGEMVDDCQVRLIRPRAGGGFFTVATKVDDGVKRRVAYRSRYVHLAPGYAGAQFLPDLQRYRSFSGDVVRVVNAYEHHEHLYVQARQRPCTVVVRGAGIVASRVLERLLTDREQGLSQTTVVHLFRNYATDRPEPRRPATELGFTLQPFNLCKSAFGGGMAERIERMPDPEQRVAAMRDAAGTTTASRRSWFDQLRRGLNGGFYQQVTGTVSEIDGSGDRLMIGLEGDGGHSTIAADFIIDATGLQGGARDHRLLNDLIEVVEVPTNPMDRIATNPQFEIEHLRSQPGRAFITGAMSMGNYFGPVDSFYGLQYAAWRVVDTICADGFAPRIGTLRSISQWWKRMRGAAP